MENRKNRGVSIPELIDYCSTGGFCEYCALSSEGKCVFSEIPALWDTEKIMEACRKAGLIKEGNNDA